ncbi:hypothetical protein BJ170DRAFT_600862 [Xylariales sp. AK1849]|nr:hypothetical protein BJ170DRAFT_600862 [Xylariales sp. AK1849]
MWALAWIVTVIKKAGAMRRKFSKPPFQAPRYLQQLTSITHERKCQRHSGIDSARSSKNKIDVDFHTSQVLHCLQEKSRFSWVIGIVPDEGSDIANLFLCELLAKGHVCRPI